MEASGQKVLKFNDRFNLTLRVDIHSAQKMLFNRYNFTAPTTVVDFLNPTTFGKLSRGSEHVLVGRHAHHQPGFYTEVLAKWMGETNMNGT